MALSCPVQTTRSLWVAEGKRKPLSCPREGRTPGDLASEPVSIEGGFWAAVLERTDSPTDENHQQPCQLAASTRCLVSPVLYPALGKSRARTLFPTPEPVFDEGSESSPKTKALARRSLPKTPERKPVTLICDWNPDAGVFGPDPNASGEILTSQLTQSGLARGLLRHFTLRRNERAFRSHLQGGRCIHCVYVPHFLYPLLRQCLGYCE